MAAKSNKDKKNDKGAKARATPSKTAKSAGTASSMKETSERGNLLIYAVIIVAIVAVAAMIYYSSSLNSNTSVPFSTFKQNFNSAKGVSISSTYSTEGQFINESQCFSSIIQIVSHTRLPKTIDFYLINQTSCTYSKTGLGGQITPITGNASLCVGRALNETGIFLNYTTTGNYTNIEPQHMYIYGNSSYMKACPIAADFA